MLLFFFPNHPFIGTDSDTFFILELFKGCGRVGIIIIVLRTKVYITSGFLILIRDSSALWGIAQVLYGCHYRFLFLSHHEKCPCLPALVRALF